MWEYLLVGGFFASLVHAGKKSAERDAEERRQREAEERRRKNTPCYYTDGISQDLFESMAHAIEKHVKRIKYIHVDGLTILGLVETNSGLSEFSFEVDFNDYGHITGKYWLKSDNAESSIPDKFADAMQYMIVNKKELFTGDFESFNSNETANSKTYSYTRGPFSFFGDLIDSIKDFFRIVWKWLKRILIVATFISILIIALYAYDYWSTKEKEKIDNRIAIGISSLEVIGQDYEGVEEQLEDAGFSYVVSYQMYDLDYSERNKEGTIGKIEVDGDETFSSSARYDKDVDIVIEYHSLKNEYPPMTSKEAKKQNYNDVVTQFKNAGFGNIKLVQEKDLITGWVTKDGSVESVSINGDVKYKTTSSFRVDAEITITYHTFKDK